MWRDTSTFASGEQSKSELAATIQSETRGEMVSMAGSVRPVRAMNFVFTGFTAAATLLALSNDISAQTLRVPNYSATAEAFYPCDRLAVAVPKAFQNAIGEMDGYRFLPDGWDGIGSVAIKPSVVDAAISFLNAFPFDFLAPEASVSADGSVSWFWNTDTIYATASFTRPGRFAYYAKNKASGFKVRGVGILDKSIPQEFLDLIKVA